MFLPNSDEDIQIDSREGFPLVLYAVLNEGDAKGHSHIIAWQPHGRCFIVHRRIDFVDQVMSCYFRMSKFASFQRQLNLYGFRRITEGQDRGEYYHELFLRGRRDLCENLRRQHFNGTRKRKPDDPKSEPNFYLMDVMPCATTDGQILPPTGLPLKEWSTSAMPIHVATSVVSSIPLPGVMMLSDATNMQQTVTFMAFMQFPHLFTPTSSNSLDPMQLQLQQQVNVNVPSSLTRLYDMDRWTAALRAAGDTARTIPPISAAVSMLPPRMLRHLPMATQFASPILPLQSNLVLPSLSIVPRHSPVIRAENMFHSRNTARLGEVAFLNLPSSCMMPNHFYLPEERCDNDLNPLGQQRESIGNREFDAYIASLQFESGETTNED